MSLLPLSPLPAATSIPVVFFGTHNRHFIIFCSLVPSRLWEKLSFALHGYKTHNEQTGRYQQPPTPTGWDLYFYKNCIIVPTAKKSSFIPTSQSTLKWITKNFFHEVKVKWLQYYIAHLLQSPFIQYKGDNSLSEKVKKHLSAINNTCTMWNRFLSWDYVELQHMFAKLSPIMIIPYKLL